MGEETGGRDERKGGPDSKAATFMGAQGSPQWGPPCGPAPILLGGPPPPVSSVAGGPPPGMVKPPRRPGF